MIVTSVPPARTSGAQRSRTSPPMTSNTTSTSPTSSSRPCRSTNTSAPRPRAASRSAARPVPITRAPSRGFSGQGHSSRERVHDEQTRQRNDVVDASRSLQSIGVRRDLGSQHDARLWWPGSACLRSFVSILATAWSPAGNLPVRAVQLASLMRAAGPGGTGPGLACSAWPGGPGWGEPLEVGLEPSRRLQPDGQVRHRIHPKRGVA